MWEKEKKKKSTPDVWCLVRAGWNFFQHLLSCGSLEGDEAWSFQCCAALEGYRLGASRLIHL